MYQNFCHLNRLTLPRIITNYFNLFSLPPIPFDAHPSTVRSNVQSSPKSRHLIRPRTPPYPCRQTRNAQSSPYQIFSNAHTQSLFTHNLLTYNLLTQSLSVANARNLSRNLSRSLRVQPALVYFRNPFACDCITKAAKASTTKIDSNLTRRLAVSSHR